MSGVAVNGTLGFLMVITLCFTLGDVTNILATPTGYPFIQIFYNATQSYLATNIMTSIDIVVSPLPSSAKWPPPPANYGLSLVMEACHSPSLQR